LVASSCRVLQSVFDAGASQIAAGANPIRALHTEADLVDTAQFRADGTTSVVMPIQ
jgi:hypothetical protein